MIEGVAVGCGWQTFVAYVNVCCYYLVGVPLGLLLGFKFQLGVQVHFLLIFKYILNPFLLLHNNNNNVSIFTY